MVGRRLGSVDLLQLQADNLAVCPSGFPVFQQRALQDVIRPSASRKKVMVRNMSFIAEPWDAIGE